jgi:TPP-dependent pyruvate/acetoin dehydrogenase alpha subunit
MRQGNKKYKWACKLIRLGEMMRMPSKEKMIEMYTTMLKIRLFEEKAHDLFTAGKSQVFFIPQPAKRQRKSVSSLTFV